MSNKIAKILWPLGAVFIMAAIFYFSSQNGQQSSLQSSFFSKWLTGIMPASLASFLVRKTAHFTIYLVLGICLYGSVQAWSPSISIPSKIVLSLLIALLYAAGDEIHQLFIDGRAGSLRDVFIDSCGALCGCTLFAWASSRRKYTFKA